MHSINLNLNLLELNLRPSGCKNLPKRKCVFTQDESEFLAQDESFLPNQIVKKLEFVEVVWLKFQQKLKGYVIFQS